MRWYHKAVIGTALTWVGLVISTGSGCGRSDDVTGTTGAGGATSTTTTGGQGGQGGQGPDVTEFEACAETQAAATLVPSIRSLTRLRLSGGRATAGARKTAVSNTSHTTTSGVVIFSALCPMVMVAPK